MTTNQEQQEKHFIQMTTQYQNLNQNIYTKSYRIWILGVVILLVLYLLYIRSPGSIPINTMHNLLQINRKLQQIQSMRTVKELEFVQKNKNTFQPKVLTAYRLYLASKYGSNKLQQIIQQYTYQNKYKISTYSQYQHPLCIISNGRNLIQKSYYKGFLASIATQHYHNYQIIYTDDCSDDGTVQHIKQQLYQKHPQIVDKFTIIENRQRKYALANLDNMIRKCANQEIVINVDADDQLIGSYVFRLINNLYANDPSLWMVYTNNIVINGLNKQIIKGSSKKIQSQAFLDHSLRMYHFTMSHLRTFRASLYQIIPQRQFKDFQTDKFWKWVADFFVYCSLAELAGYQHIKFIPQFTYLYHQDNIYSKIQQKTQIAFIGKTQKPFMPIKSINSSSQVVRNASWEISQEEKNEIRYMIDQRYSGLKRADNHRNRQSIQKNVLVSQIYQYISQDPISLQKINKDICLNIQEQIFNRAYNLYQTQNILWKQTVTEIFDKTKIKQIDTQPVCIIIKTPSFKMDNWEILQKITKTLSSLFEQKTHNYRIIINNLISDDHQNLKRDIELFTKIDYPEFLQYLNFVQYQDILDQGILKMCQTSKLLIIMPLIQIFNNIAIQYLKSQILTSELQLISCLTVYIKILKDYQKQLIIGNQQLQRMLVINKLQQDNWQNIETVRFLKQGKQLKQIINYLKFHQRYQQVKQIFTIALL